MNETTPEWERRPRMSDPDQVTPSERRAGRLRRPSAAAIRRRTAGVFDTRSERWRRAGLGAEVDRAGARRAAREAVVLLILLAGVLVLFALRHDLFPGAGKPIRFGTAVLLVVIGWALARAVGKGIAPPLMRRMDPATAGTIGFLIRLITILIVVFGALGIAGVKPETLALGGAFTAIVLGLAAQQTLGNLIAGATLLSVRPFRVADRVRVQGAGVDVEGIVASLGLFYTTLLTGGDRILIPNSLLMRTAIMPLTEPDSVEVTARFESIDVTPTSLQRLLGDEITIALHRPPRVELEEVSADDVSIFTIIVDPIRAEDAATLGSEVLLAIRKVGGEGDTDTDEADSGMRPVDPTTAD
jgi:small conductance mechanosensitive channel